jgi:DNA end-binding protein Ku
MARSMWRGAIQFGLVTIPVKLYLATESTSIGFNLLHASCLNRIQMKVYCPYHDEVISRADTVRGYEWSKGKYVVVSEEDLESVPLKTVRAIEIEKFVEASSAEESAARFVKQEYYLEPDEIGRKAFYLLKEVLADGGKTAICKIVLKDREQLAALSPYASTMLLTTLHWPDEVRSLDELALPEDQVQIKASERTMAEQLVASMTGEFDPAEYHDEYREALMGVIEAKVGGEAPRPAAHAEPTRIADLMAALEASVAAAREGRREAPVEKETAKGKAAAGGRTTARASRSAPKASTPTKASPSAGRGRAKAGGAKAPQSDEERPARRRKTA